MKSVVEQLARYQSVHLDRRNVITHIIGIPLIIWSLYLLLSMVSLLTPWGGINLALLLTMIVQGYYLLLHPGLAIGALLFILPVLYSTAILAHWPGAIWLAVVIFVLGWLFQLAGHLYEQAKPAFIDDIKQLFIGPLFLVAELYFALGWCTSLQHAIQPLARTYRQQLNATDM